MDRTTILLPHDLKVKAMKTAKLSGMSLGDLIRTSLAIYCREKTDSNEDLFFVDTHFYKGDAPKDLSTHHDDYLY